MLNWKKFICFRTPWWLGNIKCPSQCWWCVLWLGHRTYWRYFYG